MLDIAANSEDTRRIFLINLTGRIDSGTARDFDDFFRELMRKGNRFLVLEAAGLEFVSSAGIASLVSLARKLHSLSGAAAFLRLNDEIRMVLEFFGLSRELPAFDNLKDARDYLNSRAHNKSLSLEIKQSATDGSAAPEPAAETISTPAATQPVARPDGPRPLGAAAESAGAAAVPIQAMEADDLQMMIRRNVREILREESAGKSQPASAAASETISETPGAKNEGGGSGAGIAAGLVAGAAIVGTGALAASALSKGDGPTETAGTENTDRMSSPPPQATARKSDKKSTSSVKEKAVARKTKDHAAETKQRPAAVGSAAPAVFSRPRVIKCEQCREQLRVGRPGTYLCPACRIKIRVRSDGTAAFLERL